MPLPAAVLLPAIPGLPLAGYVLLALFGRRLPKRAVALIGAGSVLFAAAAAVLAAYAYVAGGEVPLRHTVWLWLEVAGFAPSIGFKLDALSMVMALVVTIVGFLIHLYSAEYMAAEEGYSRFFAYLNLFVGAMCVLVLADNMLLLLAGWEGVGLCSYLLIGFWYRDPANGRAAQKAFIVTRTGDTAFTIALLLLFATLGTLDIEAMKQRALVQWPPGSPIAGIAALLLLAGAAGKSAQLPLQTWLPDAMAGPTPVSALIHAATMVTAGVYLIARLNELFSLSPAAQLAVAVMGAATLLVAGVAALAQTDIKRVLAYSTISQIGYMFLALGVGAWSAAIFHLMTHAFFKALLFLAAGVVISAMHHEQDMRRMGGLRRRLPYTFAAFLVGAAALAALPVISAGFYSKDLILWQAWSLPRGHPALWAAGVIGAALTGCYIFRLVFLVFLGRPRERQPAAPDGGHWRIAFPLAALSLLSVVGGLVETPSWLGGVDVFTSLLAHVLPATAAAPHSLGEELELAVIAAAASLAGMLAAYLLARQTRRQKGSGKTGPLAAFARSGLGFDALYERLLMRPFVAMARAGRDDPLDRPYAGLASLSRGLHRQLRRTQDGLLRHYAAGMAWGAALLLAWVLIAAWMPPW